MPTVFKKINQSQWMVEVPCHWLGPCAIEIADGQTSGIITNSDGEASDGVARFVIPPLASGLVRITIRHGEKSLGGLCRVLLSDKPSAEEVQAQAEEVVVPLDTIRQAMPGVLVEEIKRRVSEGDLAVSKRSPMFAAVSEHLASATSCRLVGIGDDDSFRFICEVQA